MGTRVFRSHRSGEAKPNAMAFMYSCSVWWSCLRQEPPFPVWKLSNDAITLQYTRWFV